MVVEVITEGGSIADWVGGVYLGSNIVVDGALPTEGNRVVFDAYTGHEVDSNDFGSDGGVVSFGAGPGAMYVLGIRASSTVFLANTMTFLPMVVRVPPRVGRCEYAGTVHYRGPENYHLRDEFDAHRARISRSVSGCSIQPNIGKALMITR